MLIPARCAMAIVPATVVAPYRDLAIAIPMSLVESFEAFLEGSASCSSSLIESPTTTFPFSTPMVAGTAPPLLTA